MNSLFDILIGKPLGEGWLGGLLFVFFAAHLTFVLLALGTAIISIFYFVQARGSQTLPDERWDKEILRKFMPLKSLALVLGVAPLLLIQVGRAVPFFTAANLLAPFWLSLAVLMAAAFLSLDTLAHKTNVRNSSHWLFGLIGLACLLAVPGIFVAVLVVAENAGQWTTIIKHNYHLTGSLAFHWALRYLHVLGAAVVFGAGFHYFFSPKNGKDQRPGLRRWMSAGLLSQIVLGLLLYFGLAVKPEGAGLLLLGLGIAGAVFLSWTVVNPARPGRSLKLARVGPALIFVLVAMLLTRQSIQDKKLKPVDNELRTRAREVENQLRPYEAESLAAYRADLRTVYDNGKTIYQKSCLFCHGQNGDGKGPEAAGLAIPPEQLSALRTDRSYLRARIAQGVPGSAMPYFAFFDRRKIESLMDHMNQAWGLLGLPEDLPTPVPDAALAQAREIFRETCSTCHGLDGRGSAAARAFQPAVPDFTAFSLSPQGAFAVVTGGYPGTAMPAFANLPQDVRWGLVKIVNDKKISGTTGKTRA